MTHLLGEDALESLAVWVRAFLNSIPQGWLIAAAILLVALLIVGLAKKLLLLVMVILILIALVTALWIYAGATVGAFIGLH